MKTLTKLALTLTILTTAVAAQAQVVRGYLRSNGTYVAPYYRTPANGTPFDNLSYPGYPSQQPGYVSPRHEFGMDSTFTMPRHDFSNPSRFLGDGFSSGLSTMPNLGHSFKIQNYGF